MIHDDANDQQVGPSLYEASADRARQLAEDSRAESTLRAYRTDWSEFTAWCELVDQNPLPADKKTVASFLAHENGRGLAPSSINRRLAAICLVHELAGFDRPSATPAVSSVMRGVRRTSAHKVQPKRAIFSHELKKMIDASEPDTARGLRDRAVLLVGFSGAFRRAELVGIDRDDIEFVPEGLVVTLWQSKTDQLRESTQVAIPATGSEYCPALALRRWLAYAQITDGPVFRRLFRHNTVGKSRLSPQSVAKIVKEYALLAGLTDPTLPDKEAALRFSGHSLRRGFLSSAAEQGADVLRMAMHSRHKSMEVLRSYVDAANRFKDHAGDGLL